MAFIPLMAANIAAATAVRAASTAVQTATRVTMNRPRLNSPADADCADPEDPSIEFWKQVNDQQKKD